MLTFVTDIHIKEKYFYTKDDQNLFTAIISTLWFYLTFGKQSDYSCACYVW